MENKAEVVVNGRRIELEAGCYLSEVTVGELPCGGHGRCGKCKVRVKGCVSPPSEEEKRILSPHEISEGVRLACRTVVTGDAEVELLAERSRIQVLTDGVMDSLQLCPAFKNYGIAVDIGTTTIVSSLYGADGKPAAKAACLNPQSKWGADVISRIEAAQNGKGELLTEAVRGAVNGTVEELVSKLGKGTVDTVVITGNTVMLSLLAGGSVESFSHAPFKAERLFGETVTAGDISLSCLDSATPVYLPPCISAFVGADAVCAMLATGLCDKGSAMLADIGTNGELALWHDGRLSVCSTAAGPAFEGVGISMGMRGEEGAIDRVSVVNGRLYPRVIGAARPIGICGSGLVDAVASMIDLEVLYASGHLEEDPYEISCGVTVTQKDIRMVQLAKSAVCAGLLTLMDREKLSGDEITKLYVAGGFGNYLDMRSAVRIGLLPASLQGRACAVGNAALSGAAMLLLDRHMKEKAEKIRDSAKILELSTDVRFSEHFMSGMIFKKIDPRSSACAKPCRK